MPSKGVSKIELESSVINYGLDDFSGILMDSTEAIAEMTLQMENTIALFERRLSRARVLLDSQPVLNELCLSFR